MRPFLRVFSCPGPLPESYRRMRRKSICQRLSRIGCNLALGSWPPPRVGHGDPLCYLYRYSWSWTHAQTSSVHYPLVPSSLAVAQQCDSSARRTSSRKTSSLRTQDFRCFARVAPSQPKRRSLPCPRSCEFNSQVLALLRPQGRAPERHRDAMASCYSESWTQTLDRPSSHFRSAFPGSRVPVALSSPDAPHEARLLAARINKI